MFRRLFVLCLIATIVACPFRCGGAFSIACAADSTATARIEAEDCGCDCCREKTPAKRDGDTDSPLPEPCDCASCVCEGAVLPEKVLFVADDAPAVPLSEILASTAGPETGKLSSLGVPSPDAEPSPSGRSIRLLHRSLLL